MRVEDHFVRIYAVREAVMLYDIDCVRVRVCVWGCCAFVHQLDHLF